jgi:hypothetical protein
MKKSVKNIENYNLNKKLGEFLRGRYSGVIISMEDNEHFCNMPGSMPGRESGNTGIES